MADEKTNPTPTKPESKTQQRKADQEATHSPASVQGNISTKADAMVSQFLDDVGCDKATFARFATRLLLKACKGKDGRYEIPDDLRMDLMASRNRDDMDYGL